MGRVIVTANNDLWSDHFATQLSQKRTSPMTPLVRPLLSSILCCVIAFGHAPAWLHVATCEDGCGATSVATTPESSVDCSHGCHHHPTESLVATQGETASPPPAAPAGGHDSDTCAVCQSLASSNGVVSLGPTTLAFEYVCEPSFVCADRLPVEASIAIAEPRGPPAEA